MHSSTITRRKHKENGVCYRCGGKRGPVFRAKQCQACWEVEHEAGRKRKQMRKESVYQAYGGYKCVCCGETNPGFLTIDHVDGGGSKHRRDENFICMVDYLYYNDFPPGYQILCYNCNCGRGRRNAGGVCPHDVEYRSVVGALASMPLVY